jgi:prohibitin 1
MASQYSACINPFPATAVNSGWRNESDYFRQDQRHSSHLCWGGHSFPDPILPGVCFLGARDTFESHNMLVLQVPIIMDIRARPRMIHSVTGSKDLQMVNISVRMLMRPDENRLSTIYSSLGSDYDDRVLPSLANEVLKAVVAQYRAEELLSKRGVVSSTIYTQLREKAEVFGILLDDVSITHLTFGTEFVRAIENKQVAHQEAETQQYVVLKADQERLAVILRAEGEAEAAKLISDAIHSSGKGLIEVRRIDTAKEVVSTLSKSRNPNITFLPSSGPRGSSMLLDVNPRR